jgi:hypothetical protein
MFPISEQTGGILGFAGLATHLGPSWPLWLTSPERGRYLKASAVFGIRQAGPAIGEARRALVSNDCLEVLRLHQRGHREAVAVVQTPLSAEHLGLLADRMSVDAEDLGLDREGGEAEGVGDAVIVGPRAELGPQALSPDELVETVLEPTPAPTGHVERVDDTPTRGERLLRGLASGLLGLGIPLGSLWIVDPSSDDPGGTASGFVVAVGGVALAYVVLTIVASYVSGRTRARSSGRRMRAPWEHGATEWQPHAWTYHSLEEVLIAAALISVVTCLVLFVTIGGFAG